MLAEKQIAFVGGGVMAEAMTSGILRRELVRAGRVRIADPLVARVEELAARYGIGGSSSNRDVVRDADVIVLSVKPQVMPLVVKELRGVVQDSALVLSIAAGVTIRAVGDGLAHAAVVRAMPNTPAQIGKGITVWCATDEVSPAQLGYARDILSALGEEVQVNDEHYLDMATALSGTGPAYVLLFMEAMIDAGVHMGFSRRVSEQLVLQTMLGTVEYARLSGKHQAALRNEVTSPGGTSAEAIFELEKGGLRTVISEAVWAAYRRSRELGQGQSRGGSA